MVGLYFPFSFYDSLDISTPGALYFDILHLTFHKESFALSAPNLSEVRALNTKASHTFPHKLVS